MPACAVATCRNVSGRGDSALCFYRFPEDPDISIKWVLACKRKDKFNPRNVSICSDHFVSEDFERDLQAELTGQKRRKVLKKCSVPHANIPNKTECTSDYRGKRLRSRSVKRKLVEELHKSVKARKSDDSVHCNTVHDEQKTPNCQLVAEDDVNSEAYLSAKMQAMENEIMILKMKVSDLENEIIRRRESEKRLEMENKMLKQQLLKIKILHKRCPKLVKTELRNILKNVFTPKQIERFITKKKCCWEKEDIAAAITLRSISRKAYLYMKNKVGLPLPGLSTLRKWTRNLKCMPGIQTEVLAVLEATTKIMTETERITILSFDEMSVDSRLCYDQSDDRILGPNINAQVIMARGLASKWKQPIFYDFDRKITKDLLFDVIRALEERPFCVVAMVSDMGGSNIGLWKELNITPASTTFENPHSSHPVWVFADMPHAIKLLRNNFLDYGIQLPCGTVIRKDHVQAIIENTELKLSPKLTPLHIQLKGNTRQKVKFAVQLFSHHTATRLSLKYPEHPEICNFFELVDKFFDVMNSRFIHDKCKPWHSAFGFRIEEQLSIITEMEAMVLNMRIVGHKTLMPFQKGLLISVRSVIGLHNYLQKNNSLKYIITCRLNQDLLESFFSRLRSIGGTYDNPTPTDFKYRFRQMLLGSELPLPQGACVEDDSLKQKPYLTSQMFTELNLNIPENKNEENEAVQDDLFTPLTTSWEENEALRYVAGYLIHASEDANLKSIEETENKDGWIEILSRGKLTVPSSKFVKTVQHAEEIFKTHHGLGLQNGKGVVRNFFVKLVEHFPDVNKKVLMKFARTRTFIRLRHLNRQAKIASTEKKRQKKLAQLVQKTRN